MGGIGSGRNSGGNHGGAGRPRGSIDKRARQVILAAEREGKLLPLDYLLSIMHDSEAPRSDRALAPIAALPFCDSRLTTVRVIPSAEYMDDAALMAQVAAFEKLAAAMPEHERAESLKRQQRRLSRMLGVCGVITKRSFTTNSPIWPRSRCGDWLTTFRPGSCLLGPTARHDAAKASET
jgi:hypothetical protein